MTFYTVRNWTHGKFGKNVGTRGSIFSFIRISAENDLIWYFWSFQITQQLKEIANDVVNGELSERAALFQSITGIVEGEGK